MNVACKRGLLVSWISFCASGERTTRIGSRGQVRAESKPAPPNQERVTKCYNLQF